MKKITLLLFTILFALNGIAQISCEKRIEFELDNGSTDAVCYNFGTNGLTVVSSNQVKSNEKCWYFDFYDTDIVHQETKEVILGHRVYLKDTYKDSLNLYSIFVDRKGDFVIIRANIKTHEVDFVKNNMHKKLAVDDMVVVNGKAFVNTSMKKGTEFFTVDLDNGKKSPIYIEYENFTLSDAKAKYLQASNKPGELFFFALNYERKTGSEMYFSYFNEGSENSDIINLSQNSENHLSNISGYNAGDNNYVFTGTYSSKSLTAAEGLFFCTAKDGEVENLNFYNFINLNNFLDYLPERKQNKINKKKKKKADKGQEYALNYQIACHEIIKMEDGYFFLGEAYFPTYRTVTSSVNGTTTTSQVFDGYQYTHAVIVKFDFNGKILWDQCFEMYPSYKPFYVKKFVSVAEQDNSSVKLFFAAGISYYYKEFSNNGELVNDRKVEAMESNFEGDKYKYSSAEVEYWYDNYFLTYGVQKIKNKEDEDVKKKRTVFYISKIKFD